VFSSDCLFFPPIFSDRCPPNFGTPPTLFHRQTFTHSAPPPTNRLYFLSNSFFFVSCSDILGKLTLFCLRRPSLRLLFYEARSEAVLCLYGLSGGARPVFFHHGFSPIAVAVPLLALTNSPVFFELLLLLWPRQSRVFPSTTAPPLGCFRAFARVRTPASIVRSKPSFILVEARADSFSICIETPLCVPYTLVRRPFADIQKVGPVFLGDRLYLSADAVGEPSSSNFPRQRRPPSNNVFLLHADPKYRFFLSVPSSLAAESLSAARFAPFPKKTCLFNPSLGERVFSRDFRRPPPLRPPPLYVGRLAPPPSPRVCRYVLPLSFRNLPADCGAFVLRSRFSSRIAGLFLLI